MRLVSILALVLALTACAPEGFNVGPTWIEISYGADFWGDTPEVIQAMQATPDVPPKVWHTRLFFQPEGYPLKGHVGSACLYHVTGSIEVRVTNPDGSAADSCLPHEFGHAWQAHTSTTIDHGPAWADFHNALLTAAENGARR